MTSLLARTLIFLGIGFNVAVAENPQTHSERLRQREARLKSLRFTWKEDCFAGQGSIFDPATREPAPEPPLPPLPKEGMRYEQFHTFSYDGKRTNHIASLLAAQQVEGEYLRTQFRDTHDGKNRLQLKLPNKQRDTHYGRIYPPNVQNHTLSLAYVEPILQWHRLPVSDQQVDKLNLSAQDARIAVDGVKCVVVNELRRNLTGTFYLDPDRDFLLVRYVLKNGDRVARQTDFEYSADEDIGWALNGWTMQWFYNQGELSASTRATVRESEINSDLPAEEFTIDFPAGTFIDDLRKEKFAR